MQSHTIDLPSPYLNKRLVPFNLLSHLKKNSYYSLFSFLYLLSPSSARLCAPCAPCGNFGDYFCSVHIISAKLLIYSQTFINLTHIQKLEIFYEYDVCFHTKVRKSNLSCFTDYTKHTSAGALIYRQQTIYWIFTQTKLSSIYRHKPIVTYWALMNRQALLTI